jgi:hypothetical protein
MTKRCSLVLVCLSLVLALAAPAAQAGPLVKSAGDCAAGTLEHPFVRWLDPLGYVLTPGGSFEDGASGWSAGAGKVVSGNEPFYVHNRGDSKSLSIPSGSSVTSPTICVGLDKPLLRFFARSSGGLLSLSALKVDVQFETAGGTVLSLPMGVALPSGWSPTLPLPVLANLLPLLSGDQTPVRFRFTPVGGASWWIDDVYVDPRRQ